MSTKLGDITLTKKSGTTLTLNTKEKYVNDNVSFNISVVEGSVTQNAPTVDETGLVTATTSTAAGFVPTSATADSKTLQLSTKGAETYPFTTLGSATIPAGKYLTGDQTILQAYTSGIEAGNIKYGTTVKVGDSQNNGRIHNIAGTFTKANTVSSGQTAATAAQIASGYSAWVDGTEVKGNIETKTSSDLEVSGKTITAPAGYYAVNASASVATGTVTSGTATISSLTKTYNSTSGKFDVSGSANVSAPTVGTAGYVSSTEGTKNGKTGGATVSATLNKITGSTSITGTLKVTPTISKQDTPSGVTNAANGNATTTAPSSGVYVAVKATGGTNTITATPSVTTEGYGTSAQHGISGNTASVGANNSAMTYVPIKTGSVTQNAPTVNTSTGVVTATSTVTEGYVSADTKSNTLSLSTQSGKTVSPTESEQTAVSAGKYTIGAVKIGAISTTYVGSGIPRKDSTDLEVSGITVTVPAGYYAVQAQKSVSIASATGVSF